MCAACDMQVSVGKPSECNHSRRSCSVLQSSAFRESRRFTPQYQFASHTFQLYDSVLNQFVTGTYSLSLDGLTAMNSLVTTIFLSSSLCNTI
jgi:hypothetical protein